MSDRSTLTSRQADVYDAICDHIVEYHRPPTVRALADQLGISSPNGVMSHLKALQKKGFLEHEDNVSCGMKLKGVTITLQRESDGGPSPQQTARGTTTRR